MRDEKSINIIAAHASPRKVKHALVKASEKKKGNLRSSAPKAPKWKGKIKVASTIEKEVDIRPLTEAVPSLVSSISQNPKSIDEPNSIRAATYPATEPQSSSLPEPHLLVKSESRLAMGEFRKLYNDSNDYDESFTNDGQTPIEQIERERQWRNNSSSSWSINQVKDDHGWGGRMQYMSKLRRFQRRKFNTVKEEVPSSVNEQYIQSCEALGVLAEPLIVPKSATGSSTLNLSHYGVGSGPAQALSQCMQNNFSNLTVLNLKENRLDDKASSSLLRNAITGCKSLTTIDLSDNRIGRNASISLAALISTSSISLSTLVLSNCFKGRHANVAVLMKALESSQSVTNLDLSRNEISSRTCRSIASCLAENKALENLNLGWNNIRNATAIGDGLASNKSLLHLDLSYNGLSDSTGVLHVAGASRYHPTLRFLSVAGNKISGTGTMALMAAYVDSADFETLVLDNNPIGENGFRAVLRGMSNPLSSYKDRHVSLKGCNLERTAALPVVFDPCDQKEERYVLDMSIVLDSVVLFELLRYANTYEFANFSAMKIVNSATKNLEFHRLGNTDTKVGLLALKGEDKPWRGRIRKGKVSFKFSRRTHSALFKEVIDHLDFQTFIRMIKETDLTSTSTSSTCSTYKLISLFVKDHVFTATQSKILLNLVVESEKPLLLKSMLNSICDANHLLDKDDEKDDLTSEQRRLLQSCIGKLSRFDKRMPNGRYSLDLSVASDVNLLATLASISGKQRQRDDFPDTSQHGNSECFRNEFLNGAKMIYNPESLSVLPESGILAFDFFINSREVLDVEVMSDTELSRLSQDLYDFGNDKMTMNTTTTIVPRSMMNVATAAMEKFVSTEEKLLRFLSRAFVNTFVTCKQLFKIFESNKTYRVSCIVAVLHHVVDLENFLSTISLPAREVREIIRRVGWLNIWTPKAAKMRYNLNLAIYEERVMAEILIKGDNSRIWKDVSFNNKFGWELPLSWQTSVPCAGKLSVTVESHNNNYDEESSLVINQKLLLVGVPLTRWPGAEKREEYVKGAVEKFKEVLSKRQARRVRAGYTNTMRHNRIRAMKAFMK